MLNKFKMVSLADKHNAKAEEELKAVELKPEKVKAKKVKRFGVKPQRSKKFSKVEKTKQAKNKRK